MFIVNGRIDKADGNFLGGFFFNKVKDTNIIIGSYPLSQNDLIRMKKAGVTAVMNIQTGNEMTERGVFWPQMKQKYRENGIDCVMSYPIPDHDEDNYVEELFNCSQHLNDMITERGHTVYINDNSSITRAPTLALTYLCLFVKIRTYENLPEACRLIKQYHNVSTPNVKILEKTLKKHRLFQEKQRQAFEEEDNDQNGTYLKHRIAYRATGGELRKESVQEEVEYLFNRSTEAPIAFNGTHGNATHALMQKSIDQNGIQLPIIHLQSNIYLIGVAFCEIEVKDNGFNQQQVYVIINKGR